MILERRAYTLRPGLATEFWNLQYGWNRPDQIPLYLERNVGYFESSNGNVEQIIHLQRYDDFADWQQRVASNQKQPGRGEYYAAARRLLTAQENCFFSPSPVAALSPLWNASRDWLPGQPCFPIQGDTRALAVVEEVTDLYPGSVPQYWDRLKESSEFGAENLIGTFSSIVGQLHRVTQYRWFPDETSALAHTDRLAAGSAWADATNAVRGMVRQTSSSMLRLSPVPWMRALFTPGEA